MKEKPILDDLLQERIDGDVVDESLITKQLSKSKKEVEDYLKDIDFIQRMTDMVDWLNEKANFKVETVWEIYETKAIFETKYYLESNFCRFYFSIYKYEPEGEDWLKLHCVLDESKEDKGMWTIWTGEHFKDKYDEDKHSYTEKEMFEELRELFVRKVFKSKHYGVGSR